MQFNKFSSKCVQFGMPQNENKNKMRRKTRKNFVRVISAYAEFEVNRCERVRLIEKIFLNIKNCFVQYLLCIIRIRSVASGKPILFMRSLKSGNVVADNTHVFQFIIFINLRFLVEAIAKMFIFKIWRVFLKCYAKI